MTDKPTRYPEWATNSDTDTITGLKNKLEPSPEFKLSGLKRNQPLPRQYLNDELNLISTWIKWADEQLTGVGSATLEAAWPVGSVYLAVDSTNPATKFGFGTWSAIAQGKALFGYNSGDADFSTIEGTGGAKTHTHGGTTGGTAITIAQMPAHAHMIPEGGVDRAVYGYATGQESVIVEDWDNTTTSTDRTLTSATGGGEAHAHTIPSASSLPPYLVIVAWKRTA